MSRHLFGKQQLSDLLALQATADVLLGDWNVTGTTVLMETTLVLTNTSSVFAATLGRLLHRRNWINLLVFSPKTDGVERFSIRYYQANEKPDANHTAELLFDNIRVAEVPYMATEEQTIRQKAAIEVMLKILNSL